MADAETLRKRAAYMRAYTRSNADKINAQRRARRDAETLQREREWRDMNRDKTRVYKKSDREKRPDDYRQWKKEWRERNKEKLQARSKVAYAAEKKAMADRLRKFREANPDRYRAKQIASGEKRRAKLANVAHERIDRRAVYERDGRKCGICGRAVRWADFSLDHIVPVARGGAHILSNVQTSHLNCNKRKGHRGPVQPRLGL